MVKPVSAIGERQAIGGFLPQFGEYAWLAYRQMLHNSLEWVRVADPEAQHLDDIFYATKTAVFAFQVKWAIAGAAISLSAFSQLLPSLVSSWKGRESLNDYHWVSYFAICRLGQIDLASTASAVKLN